MDISVREEVSISQFRQSEPVEIKQRMGSGRRLSKDGGDWNKPLLSRKVAAGKGAALSCGDDRVGDGEETASAKERFGPLKAPPIHEDKIP